MVARRLGEIALACYAAAADPRRSRRNFPGLRGRLQPRRRNVTCPPSCRRSGWRALEHDAGAAGSSARWPRLCRAALLRGREGSGAAARARAARHATNDALAALPRGPEAQPAVRAAVAFIDEVIAASPRPWHPPISIRSGVACRPGLSASGYGMQIRLHREFRLWR